MGPIISVFVLVLIVSILAGLTFLFVANLKDTALETSDRTSVNVLNESVTFDSVNTVQDLDTSTLLSVACGTPTQLINTTVDSGEDLLVGNVTMTSDCTLINATALADEIGNGTVFVSYPYTYILSLIHI